MPALRRRQSVDSPPRRYVAPGSPFLNSPTTQNKSPPPHPPLPHNPRQAARGGAATTLEAYRRDLTRFAARLAARGVSIEAADTDAVRDHIQGLARAGLAPGTSARHLSSLRQFYRFLFAEGIRRQDATAGIDSPRQGRWGRVRRS